jgi:hypothetical protein
MRTRSLLKPKQGGGKVFGRKKKQDSSAHCESLKDLVAARDALRRIRAPQGETAILASIALLKVETTIARLWAEETALPEPLRGAWGRGLEMAMRRDEV